MATKSQSLIDLGKQVLAENKAPVETPVATAPEVSTPVNQPATPTTVLPPTPVAPVETPTAPAPVAPVPVEAPVAPVMDNKPATPSTVQAPATPKPTAEEKKVQETTNQALAINKMVDKNRANGMDEQQAFQSAMKEFRGVKPTVRELRTSVPDTGRLGTPDERRAQFENNKLSKYNTMTSEQLFSELKSGNLTPKVQQELSQNPAYAKAKEKYDKQKQVDNINSSTASLLGVQTQKDPLAELSNTLVNIFSQQGGQSSVGQFREYLSQNPTITGKTAEYNTLAAERMEVQRARDSVVKDLKKKYALPMSTILAMAARETEPLNERLNTLNDSMAILGSEIKQETEFAQKEFDIFREEQAAAQAKQTQLQQLLGNLAISDYQTNRQQAFEAQKIQSAQQFEIGMEQMKNKYQNDRDANNYVRDLEKIGINNFYDLQKMEKDQNFQKQIEAIKNKYAMSRSVQELNNDITKMGYQFSMAKEGKALDLANEKEMLEYKASLDPDLAEKWEAVRAKATENSSLADLYGKNVGTYEGNRGYDLAGKMGDAIVAPPGARVIEVNSLNDDGTVSIIKDAGEGQTPIGMTGKDKGWGNSVVLQLPDGKFMRLSHLQNINANVGSTLAGGQVVGTRGNSGNVVGKNGEKLTPEQLAAGRGAHVDVEIAEDSGFKKLLNQSEQLEYLKSVKPFAKQVQQEGITDVDIETFNNPTFKPADIKDPTTKAKFDAYTKEKARIKTAKDVSIDDILRFSAGGKDLSDTNVISLTKYNQALQQLDGIEKQIKDTNNGPIIGKIAQLNPYDTNSQVLKAALSALIPNLARGVYGEVGVLTDQDIENYAKTIPNLTSTDAVNDAVLAMTLDTVAEGYKQQLRTLAASGRDVSGFVSLYGELKAQADNLKAGIGMTGQPTQTQKQGSYDAYMSKPLY